MRDNMTKRRWLQRGLLIALWFLLLGLSPTRVLDAAPPLQATGTTEESTATQEPATATPTEIPQPSEVPVDTPTLVIQAQPLGGCQIEGFVFNDLNRDGGRQGDEPGLVNVLVFLQNEDSSPITERTTNEAGAFCFEAGTVAPGRYQLVQDKVAGYETTGGQARLITVNEGETTQVFFANIQIATATTAPPTATSTEGPRETPTPQFSPTATITLTPSATNTATNTATSTPTQTGTPPPTETPTETPTASPTWTPTVTPSTTPSPTATSTLRSLTPIATYITTTPGVLVTTTPVGGAGPVDRLPETGSSNSVLPAVATLILLLMGAGLVRRLLITR